MLVLASVGSEDVISEGAILRQVRHGQLPAWLLLALGTFPHLHSAAVDGMKHNGSCVGSNSSHLQSGLLGLAHEGGFLSG